MDPNSCLTPTLGLQTWGSRSSSDLFLSPQRPVFLCVLHGHSHGARGRHITASRRGRTRCAVHLPSFSQGPPQARSRVMARAPAPQPPTCARAVCSPASACSSGPHWSGCHSPVLSLFFPGSSPARGRQRWGWRKPRSPQDREARDRGTEAMFGEREGPHAYVSTLSGPPTPNSWARTGSLSPESPDSCWGAPHDPRGAHTH